MRKKILRIIFPALLALSIGIVPVVLANTGGGHDAGVAEMQAEPGHGVEQAAAGHGEVVEGHGAAGVHGEAGGSLSPKKLKDLFWRAVNFIALLIILIKFAAKPLGNALAGRQQQVREELEDFQTRRDEAERTYKEFETRLAGMEKEMESVVKKAIAQAQVEKERILEAAEKAADDIKRQAEAAVQAEIVEAKKTLQNEVAEQAAAMAEELIIKNLTQDDQIKITEQYLDRVGAVQ